MYDCVCLGMCGWRRTHDMTHVWRSEDNLKCPASSSTFSETGSLFCCPLMPYIRGFSCLSSLPSRHTLRLQAALHLLLHGSWGLNNVQIVLSGKGFTYWSISPVSSDFLWCCCFFFLIFLYFDFLPVFFFSSTLFLLVYTMNLILRPWYPLL